jgi:hypothetical protein
MRPAERLHRLQPGIRAAWRAAFIVLLSQAGCAPLQPLDPVAASLRPHLNKPVMNMVRRFGPAVQERLTTGERRYVWTVREPACSISARVDGRELVIDVHWSGDPQACSRLLSDTALL